MAKNKPIKTNLEKSNFTNFMDNMTSYCESCFGSMLDDLQLYSETSINTSTIKRMLKDDIISGAISEIILTTLSQKYNINPAINDEEDTEYEQYLEKKKFTEYCFNDSLKYYPKGKKRMGNNIYKILYAILKGAISYEVSISEINYRIEDKGNYQGFIVLDSIKVRNKAYSEGEFELYADNNGDITKVTQNSREIPVDKLLIYFYSDSDELFSDPSLFDSLYRDWYCKETLKSLRNIYLELVGKINIYCKGNIPDTTEEPEKAQALKSMLSNFSKGAVAFFPDDLDVTVADVTTTNKGQEFDNAIEKYNESMRRKLGISKLTSENDSVGSNALAKTITSNFLSKISYIQRDLECLMNEVIYKLESLNFNLNKFSTFNFPDLDELTLDNKRLNLETLYKNRIVDSRYNKTALEYLGMPVIELKDEEIIEEETEINDNINDENNDIDIQTTENKELAEKVSEPKWINTKLLTDSQIDTLKVNHELATAQGTERLKKVGFKQIETLFDYKKIEKILKKKDYEAINKTKMPFTKEMQDVMYSDMNKFYKISKNIQKDEINAKTEKELVDFVISEEASKEVAESLKAIALKNKTKISTEILNVYSEQVVSGIENGLTAKKVIDNSYKELETQGLLGIKDYKYTALVNTSMTSAMNFGRFEVSKKSKLLQGYQYVAILDGRTTTQCQKLHLSVFRPTDERLEYVKPPMHFNCRSTIIPILFEDDYNEALTDYVAEKGNTMQSDIQKGLDETPSAFGGNKTTRPLIKEQ